MDDTERAQAMSEIYALNTLMESQWYMEECENANHHSEYDWLKENRDQREAEVKA
jgi:hypothetical protein